MCGCVRVCVRACVRVCVRTCVGVGGCVCACVRACVRACVCIHGWVWVCSLYVCFVCMYRIGKSYNSDNFVSCKDKICAAKTLCMN